MNDWKIRAGRTLMVGLPGPALENDTADRLRALRPGGVILFARNLETVEQTTRLVADVRALLTYPLLVAIDQEGGRVSRLEPWIGKTPSAAALAEAGASATRRFAAATATALRALGFNLDFAPVVDLCAPDVTNGIGNRSFGPEPSSASDMAGAFLDGLQSKGVAGCLKHFPGLGATNIDSHEALPTAERTSDEIERLDLMPYRRLAATAATVMIGHGHYPMLDPAPNRPATLSRSIVTGLLRETIGFAGLVVSDDLEMGAVAPLDRDGQAAVEAVRAGCDLVLYCRDPDLADRASAALVAAAETNDAFADRLRSAESAVGRTAAAWPAALPDASAWDQACRNLSDSTEPA